MPLEIESITGGGATAEDIIPEQELTFVHDESNDVYTFGGHNLFNITSIALGKEYKVVWGSDEFSCTAIEGIFLGQYPMIAIGNPVMVGGENNNMPFAIGYITIPDDGDSQYSCIIVSLDGSASKRVRVYQDVGGVQDDRVKYVTFIGLNGVELHRQPVIVGDTCRDPVTNKYIETPTKESTPQYTYTYSGWSLTEGGDASGSALTNVTTDRTVYVAFTESVRKYTVNFYDGETLLATKQVEYGGSASYNATKEDYLLSGWNPEPTNVTEDMDCYAVWTEFQIIPFAEASWEYISMVSQMGIASKVFSLGDTKTITVKVGATPAEDVNLCIAEFDCPEKDGKTAMALIPTTLISAVTQWKSVNVSTSGTSAYSTYITTTYHSFLTNTVVASLPSELQAVMKQGKWKGSGTGYISITGLTTSEVGRKGNGTTDCLFGFDSTNASRIRKDKNGAAQNWWVVGTGSEVESASALRSSPIFANTGGSVGSNATLTGSTKYYVMFKIFV
jgi:hypothetical protein